MRTTPSLSRRHFLTIAAGVVGAAAAAAATPAAPAIARPAAPSVRAIERPHQTLLGVL